MSSYVVRRVRSSSRPHRFRGCLPPFPSLPLSAIPPLIIIDIRSLQLQPLTACAPHCPAELEEVSLKQKSCGSLIGVYSSMSSVSRSPSRSRSRSPVGRKIRSDRFSYRDAPYRRDSRRGFRFLVSYMLLLS
ncbi:hypothetical protein CRG98_024849 [Punica granatum]|uniref:Uncharacterized protein n=1 Tax=Punica granatum TaxID=22663 RepID=A0A2I0JET4_PUNGR|nr:hypothetical protein CRG98_024849 [Punica granatum]